MKISTASLLLPAVLLTCLILLSSCSETGYLLQCVTGHMDVMHRAELIDDLLQRDDLSPELKKQLQQVTAIRNFAVSQLHLPDNGSYRHYADLERPYAVWNVVAAPEFSLELKKWCFPVAGCVTYRGYYAESGAQSMATTLVSQGFDTEVYGVQAYSTLSWFKDPVLNTFPIGDEFRMAALLFHELAHQVVYVPGDTDFNESFAKAVELAGLHLWLQNQSDAEKWQSYLQHAGRYAELQELLSGVAAELTQLYTQHLTATELRRLKSETLEQITPRYQLLKESWGGYSAFDLWMSRGWNNARLGSIRTYQEFVPNFQAILLDKNNDFQAFYEQVRTLASLPQEERQIRLRQYGSSNVAALSVVDLTAAE